MTTATAALLTREVGSNPVLYVGLLVVGALAYPFDPTLSFVLGLATLSLLVLPVWRPLSSVFAFLVGASIAMIAVTITATIVLGLAGIALITPILFAVIANIALYTFKRSHPA